MKEFHGLETALSKANESLYAAQRTQLTTRMRLSMGLATLNELRNAERAVLAAEKDVTQARYNRYLGTKKVQLLKEGVLVN
jgi:outer membrane protein TolC